MVSCRRINLLHLVLSFRRGGRRNAITNLARHAKDEVNVHLCCIEELGCDKSELDGLFHSTSSLNRSPGNQFEACRRLGSLCRECDIDLIHAHDAASQYLGAMRG